MMNALLIAFLIVIYTMQSLLTRYYSTYYPGRADMASPVFTVVSGLVVFVVSMAFAGFRFEASPITLILALINALALVLYNTTLIKASSTGPYSITMVFMIAGGIIIPAVAAAFFGDDISPVKIISILVVLISVYMISRKAGEVYQNKKTFFLSCIGLAVGNGIYGMLLDIQQRLTLPAGMEVTPEKEEMVALTYLCAALISAVLLIAKEKKEFLGAMKQNKKSLFFLIAASLVVAFAINLMVYILALVDTTILYTLDNSCVFLLSVIFSCIYFKEKLSRLNIIGCITLCAALVCMSLSGQIMEFFTSLF
ncbi:MAG: hypothetical protein IJW92_02870 [Clostridia bacterium]|nr:hypothetical protein [Clostridia bacterium]